MRAGGYRPLDPSFGGMVFGAKKVKIFWGFATGPSPEALLLVPARGSRHLDPSFVPPLI